MQWQVCAGFLTSLKGCTNTKKVDNHCSIAHYSHLNHVKRDRVPGCLFHSEVSASVFGDERLLPRQPASALTPTSPSPVIAQRHEVSQDTHRRFVNNGVKAVLVIPFHFLTHRMMRDVNLPDGVSIRESFIDYIATFYEGCGIVSVL